MFKSVNIKIIEEVHKELAWCLVTQDDGRRGGGNSNEVGSYMGKISPSQTYSQNSSQFFFLSG